MSNPKSIAALNELPEALTLFRQKLMPFVIDARGKRVEADLGDYAHIILDHPEMQSRVGWLEATLKNPLEIRQHPDRNKSFRELYINQIYTSEEEPFGEWHLVVIDARPFCKLWTSFIPQDESYVRQIQKRGKLLWTRHLSIG